MIEEQPTWVYHELRRGEHYLRHLGPAFYTKIMYFVGYDEQILPNPLILDPYVAAAASNDVTDNQHEALAAPASAASVESLPSASTKPSAGPSPRSARSPTSSRKPAPTTPDGSTSYGPSTTRPATPPSARSVTATNWTVSTRTTHPKPLVHLGSPAQPARSRFAMR